MINKFMEWLSNDIGLPWFIVIIIIIVIFILSIVLFQNIYDKLNDYMTNSRFKKQWDNPHEVIFDKVLVIVTFFINATVSQFKYLHLYNYN